MTVNGTSPALPAALAALGGQLAELQQRITALERGQATAALDNASIEGGALTINDAAGNPQLILGLQPDGTFAQAAYNAAPPPQCSDPLVGATIGGILVQWDGNMFDGSPPLSDFAGVQVHCSGQPGFTPGPATLQSTLLGPGIRPIVGLQPAVTYYVCLVTVNDAGVTAPPSNYLTAVPLTVVQAIPPSAIGPDKVSFSVTAAGTKVTFSPTAPASPAAGDLWYNTASGNLLSQWSGTGWQPYAFGGGAISAGSITGSLIAAGTITAGNIAAGTVITGIVDTTTIVAPLLIGSQVLAYGTSTPRGPLYYDFETPGSVMGWAASAGSLTQSTAWSSTGTGALLLTASGAGSPVAFTPAGTAAVIPVLPGDPVAVSADLQAPAGITNGYVGIRWYTQAGAFISETDCSDAALTAGALTTLTVGDNAPAAGYAAVCFGNHGTLGSGTLIYGDNIQISGNLVYSTSPSGGVDSVGNGYSQGLEVNAMPGMTSVISVQDPWGDNTLATIDSGGNITGQTGTFADAVLGGRDFLTDWVPSFPAGLIARTNVFAANLPTTATSSEYYLYELDFQATANRSYMLVLEPMWLQFSGAGGCKINVYATTDGSQPTNASALIMQGSVEASGSSGFSNIRSPAITKHIESQAGALWRILVSYQAFGTGSTPTVQLQALDANPGDDSQVNARFYIYDMGLTLPNTGRIVLATSGGSGSGTKNFTKTYTATHSYSYQGSDGGNGNLKINTDSKMYQGGDFYDTYNGRSKTWFVFPGALASDLSGATITNVQLYLNNNHTWSSSGMTACIGWDAKSTFGSTAGDPGGAGIDLTEVHFSPGQAKWVNVPNSIASNLASGAANSLVLFKNSNSLGYYGYFAGAGQSSGPQLKVSYTK